MSLVLYTEREEIGAFYLNETTLIYGLVHTYRLVLPVIQLKFSTSNYDWLNLFTGYNSVFPLASFV